jgi:hypothetical protein
MSAIGASVHGYCTAKCHPNGHLDYGSGHLLTEEKRSFKAPAWKHRKMVFSSNFFIFAYLPVVLVIYFSSPTWLKNFVLLIASMAFYAFDAGPLIWLLIVSIILNHFVGRAIARRTGIAQRTIFATAVAINLGFLLYYKYAAFLWSAAAPILSLTGLSMGKPPIIDLPIGISFYTFQAISYIADIYSKRIVPARRLIDFAAYHSLFPQLIAGPIVRYIEIEEELYRDRGSLDGVADGLFRFCIGLGKKLILADSVGALADSVFNLPGNDKSPAQPFEAIFHNRTNHSALPSTVLFGSSFLDRYLLVGAYSYFKDIYRVRGTSNQIGQALRAIPPGTRYFVFEFYEPHLPALRQAQIPGD